MDASTQSTDTTGSFTAAAWDRIAPIMAEIEVLPLLQRLSDG
ncbi:thiaminase II, partial [Rhizobium ruizarguesonis]